jgi:hypothetical protein
MQAFSFSMTKSSETKINTSGETRTFIFYAKTEAVAQRHAAAWGPAHGWKPQETT